MPKIGAENLIGELRELLRDANSSEFADRAVVASWRERLQSAMQDAPGLKPEMGVLMGELMRESKRWASRIGISGRWPARRRKAIECMPAAGVTHVVTLLCEKEGAPTIGADVQRAGIGWIWLPLENGEPPPMSNLPQNKIGFSKIGDALAQGRSFFLHCSAGIHRTGMIRLCPVAKSGEG